MYGETLHSGQVTDHASPATGEYVRSDVSEEPQLGHGRSTRAGNRGATNGHALKRTLDSEDDEEDATSWDGGDDEEEPEQMELDDDDEDAGNESSEEEDELQSLVVTLRYSKGTSQVSQAPSEDTAMTHGVDYPSTSSAGAQQSETVAAPLAPAPQPAVPFATNGTSVQSQQPYTAPVISVAHQQPPIGNLEALPKLDGFFSAPTPPYNAPEETLKPQQATGFAPSHAEVPSPQHTAPTPAANWQ
jgi:hypothetical protein